MSIMYQEKLKGFKIYCRSLMLDRQKGVLKSLPHMGKEVESM